MKLPRRQFLHLAAGAAALPVVSQMARAQTGLTQSKTGSRLITLGTAGGPPPRAHQAQTSNLLTVNGTHYVIDAGDGVARRIAKAGIDVRDIGTIFITHHHDDHTAGLGTLMSVAWDNQRTSPINVYGPPPTEALVKAAVQYYAISAEIRIADGGRSIPVAQIFNGHDIGTGLIYQDVNIKVSAVQNSHFDLHKGSATGKHKSYPYRFEIAVTELAKGADLLVTETSSFQERMQAMIDSGQWQAMTPAEQEGITRQATQGHMTTEIIGKMATRANVKTVILTHLTYRPDGDYTSRADEVRKHFLGQVLVGA